MKVVIQRVARAEVRVEGEVVGKVGAGLVVLLGVAKGDTETEVEKLVEKIINLRVMSDGEGKMNLSLMDTKGEMLLVSQFTLLADTRKGRRPSFVGAAEPAEGERLYEEFVRRVGEKGVKVAMGRFGAMMEVELVNDGPVTIILNTEEL